MGASTEIAWTDATWTPIRARRKDNGKVGVHCVKVSPECAHCYSESFNKRNLPNQGTGLPFTVLSGDKVDVFLDEKILMQPLSWRKGKKIFVCSQTDLFGEFIPDELILAVFQMMAKCPRHTFQILTKRATRMRQLLSKWRWRNLGHSPAMGGDHYAKVIDGEHRAGDAEFLPNVWIGVTAGTQKSANERVPELLRTPATVRFVSVEPLLEEIRLWKLTSLDYHDNSIGYETYPLDGMQAMPDCDWEHAKLDWVIAGGESGSGARPMHPDWVRSLRDQCVAAGVPFFFKQHGAYVPITHDNSCGVAPNDSKYIWLGRDGKTFKPGKVPPGSEWIWAMRRVGVRKAGRLLDGREWNEFPEVKHA